jgi:hypothetical protein
MAAHIRNEPALALIYGHSRDNYQGTTPAPVAEPREPVRLVSFRRFSDGVLLLVEVAGDVRIFRVTALDSAGLELLSAADRANVQSALATIKQEVGNAS